MTETLNEFGEDTQRVLLAFMLNDKDLFSRSRSIVKDEYFENKLRPAVRYIQEYSEEYGVLPMAAQVKAQTGVVIDSLGAIEAVHNEWFLDTIERFCRQRAVLNVVLDGPDLLEKGMAGEIERRLKDAMLISLTRDLGSDYFSDPATRIKRIRDNSGTVPTGFRKLDYKLFGGFAPGSLNVFCGGSGSGKSLWLQNLALNWVEMGKHVVYITLELSEDLTDLRIDQMVTGLTRDQILKNVEHAAALVSVRGRDAGTLTSKKFPEGGTTANHIRSYLKEYTIQKGHAPDVILVDYLDLLHPNNAKIDVSSLFTKDKYVSEELRAIAGDYQVPLVTASQLNRQSVEASEFDHSHIAGGISKINTADNVMAILCTNVMREEGKYQLQFLKTRSAAAVGHKIDMVFHKESLRISDGPDEEVHGRGSAPAAVREELKTRTAEQIHNAKAIPANAPAESSPMKSSMANLMAQINSRRTEG